MDGAWNIQCEQGEQTWENRDILLSIEGDASPDSSLSRPALLADGEVSRF